MFVIQRTDSAKRVIVRSANNELIDVARALLTMEDKFDSITLMTDGVEWVVVSYRRCPVMVPSTQSTQARCSWIKSSRCFKV